MDTLNVRNVCVPKHLYAPNESPRVSQGETKSRRYEFSSALGVT